MRLQFVEGKQKELIRRFKISKDLTWKDLSALLKIEQGRLKAYYYETSLIDEEIYNKLKPPKNYVKYLLEKKDKNWGARKGGINSSGSTKKIKFPENSKEFAEFYGIMLGDGNSHRTSYYISRKDKKGTYMIRVVGDSRLDKIYLIGYVKPLIENLFDIKVRIGKFKNMNAMFLESHSKELISFLEKKGFPPGNKIKNKLEIPFWIKQNPEFLKACLRGLYDTDGSVYKLTNQNSHQICFTNVNTKLLKDVRDSLLSLGINCSNISKKDIYITKKSELRKFLKLVDFNNNKHFEKVYKWNLRSPIV